MFSRLGMIVAGPIIAILIISVVFLIIGVFTAILDGIKSFFGWLD